MSIQTIGQVTGSELLVFTAAIHSGLEKALAAPAKNVQYGKIALVKNVAGTVPPGFENGSAAGAMGRTIPDNVIFPFSPPTAQAEELTGDRTFHPLIRAAIKCPVKPFGAGYKIKRKDFFNDVWGTVRLVPDKLSRAAKKLGDLLVASVLRNGKTITDYTNTNFFAAGKPLAPGSGRPGTFANLRTLRPLTSINLGTTVNEMMDLTNEDGLSLNIVPDTLIIPPTLYQQAIMATKMVSGVFSGTGASSLGNPWPGQEVVGAATAAQGPNWVALEGIIKQIVVLPELTIGGSAIDKTTWYLGECLNEDHGGPVGLCFAEDPAVEFLQQMDLSDPTVFLRDEYAWAIQKWAGCVPGLPQFLFRCEA